VFLNQGAYERLLEACIQLKLICSNFILSLDAAASDLGKLDDYVRTDLDHVFALACVVGICLWICV
jgi:formate hydrogenlyase subunit 4